MISPSHCDNLYFRISGYTDIPSCYILFFSFPDLNFSFTVFLGPNLTNQLQLNEVDLKTSLNRLYKEPKICWTEIASSLNRGFLILFLVCLKQTTKTIRPKQDKLHLVYFAAILLLIFLNEAK